MYAWYPISPFQIRSCRQQAAPVIALQQKLEILYAEKEETLKKVKQAVKVHSVPITTNVWSARKSLSIETTHGSQILSVLFMSSKHPNVLLTDNL